MSTDNVINLNQRREKAFMHEFFDFEIMEGQVVASWYMLHQYINACPDELSDITQGLRVGLIFAAKQAKEARCERDHETLMFLSDLVLNYG